MELINIYETLDVSIKDIFLDVNNPRFSSPLEIMEWGPFDVRSQELARRRLVAKHGANNLVESIANLGFLSVDRVVVSEKAESKYIVVEGNRRIAAIKTILRKYKYGLISISEEVLASLENIQVLVLKGCEEDDLTPLLLQGLRHISGVRSWGPYQQARLIHELVSKGNMTIKEASSSVGLSAGRTSVLLKAFYGIEQMRDDAEYGKYCSLDMFSYFEHAYLKIPVREWLGWDDATKMYTEKENLEKFYSLIIPDSESGNPALLARDVRDRLPEVINSREARHEFLASKITIDEAYNLARPNVDVLDPFFKAAKELITKKNTMQLNSYELDMFRKICSYSQAVIDGNK